jgi:aminodeoxyfutalosine synthase
VNASPDPTSGLAEGRRAKDDEILSLGASHDIISLGMRADQVRRRLHGLKTTFVRVVTVPADVGVLPSWSAAGEIRISGQPTSLQTAVNRVEEISSLASGIPLSGFSLADLERLAMAEGVPLRSVLEALRGAGLELVAEAAVDTLQDARRSIEEVNIAGLTLARLTLSQLPVQDYSDLLKRVVGLQRSVGVIRTFAPLPRKWNPSMPSTGYEDVKRVAMARLMVDNIASIQVDWALYGPKLAQVALTVGADDVDNVSA